jgi:multidrug efflux pump subunit AcrB
MMLAISGELPYEELYARADEIKSSLEKLPGVGSVTLEGAYQ